ncbi:chromate transporter [Mycoplasmopsis columboralis]|uniref:Chromate transporter n=1 Tax=Mycoplasmopsis columboralis TaxID=171282 RepID=A0A449B6W6_9BACT|nr:chromate transporter [Mycoplasmopsis columboralis]VEU76351.1 Chromate transporter [Mycoplasmopsis columboralis]
MTTILISLVAIVIVSLTVFGGGALFMPVFEWLWKFLNNNFGVAISTDQINAFFTAGNATPGILSPKFAVFTGYALTGNTWWSFLLILLAYLAFMIPGIAMLLIFRRIIQKHKKTLFVSKFFTFMYPVLIGVMLSLAISIFLKITYPFLFFNTQASEYLKLDYSSSNNIYQFFRGWRLILLFVYSPLAIGFFIYLIIKKVPIIYMIVGNILVGLIIFAPWI